MIILFSTLHFLVFLSSHFQRSSWRAAASFCSEAVELVPFHPLDRFDAASILLPKATCVAFLGPFDLYLPLSLTLRLPGKAGHLRPLGGALSLPPPQGPGW